MKRLRLSLGPHDQIGQRQLVFELKHAIDRVKRRPWDARAARHLNLLLAENWSGAHSTHVQHNIGKERREFLFDWDVAVVTQEAARIARLLPSRHEAASLGRISRDEGQ